MLEKALKPTEGDALRASECLPNSAIQTIKRREIEYVTPKPAEEKTDSKKESMGNSNQAVKEREGRKKISP